MAIVDKVQEPLAQSVALIFGHSVDVLDMAANGDIYTLKIKFC
jgi:hypothetical protein